MSSEAQFFRGASVFDGTRLQHGVALVIRGGRVAGIAPEGDVPDGAEVIPLDGGVLAPGFVDLQVNGGGGVMLNDAPTHDNLRTISEAHARLGATSILPTLITDTPEKTRAAVASVCEARAQNTPGILGLHLEGPHLSQARKGAHDPNLIRKMSPEDEAFLLDVARNTERDIGVLKMTLAPESVSFDQMHRLSQAGILLSLGHSDADYDTCVRAAKQGVTCVTHLFNAMSQMGNRTPGLVGAALDTPTLFVGVIADNQHIHPATLRAALRAKRGVGRVFLVSDSMAPAGTKLDHFELGGRRISRSNGRLTLGDGTLAGADLDLARAVFNVAPMLEDDADAGLEQALAMATATPAACIGQAAHAGHLVPGAPADFIHLHAGICSAVWRAGQPLEPI